MPKGEASVEELIGMIERGVLRLPEMQRRYVWRSTRVRDLLDSLYRGYPSGAILLWETDDGTPLRDMAVIQQANPFQGSQLLLDGQQRLTSLLAVIRGKPINVRGRNRPIELLFNLNHPDQLAMVTEVNEDGDDDDEELSDDEADSNEDELQKRFNNMTFVVATRQLEQLPHWVKVSDVFGTTSDAEFLRKAGVTGFDHPNYERYTQRLARLRGVRNYMYRMDILDRQLTYDEVTEIFVRVNSLGAKLRGSDLALAQITAKWRNSLRIFEDFQHHCAEAGFEFDLGLLLKNLVAFATGQSRFLTVGSLRLETLQRAWGQSCEGMNFALNFLRNNVKIDSPALLSSPFIAIALACYGDARKYELSADESHQLRYWVLVANAKGHYSRGSTETILDQDLATIRSGGGIQDLIDRLRLQVGRLEITPEDLAGRSQRSALFKTMFLAFREAGATDWRTHIAISLDHTGAQHRIQFHHIFPKGILNGRYSRHETDEIANLAFIGGRMNRQISDKPPSQYLPDLISRAGIPTFDAQCIPTDPSLLNVEDYKEFLQRRRELIANRLNMFLTA